MKRLFLAVAVLSLLGCAQGSAESDTVQFLMAKNGPVEVQLPRGWKAGQDDNPFDLQCFSKDESMMTAVFLFLQLDLAEDLEPEDLLDLQIEDLASKRTNFKLLEERQTVSLENKTLTSAVYSGEKGPSRYHYRFTLIEFADHPEYIPVVIQTGIPSDWAEQKPILEGLTRSARVSLKGTDE